MRLFFVFLGVRFCFSVSGESTLVGDRQTGRQHARESDRSSVYFLVLLSLLLFLCFVSGGLRWVELGFGKSFREDAEFVKR